MMPLALHSVLPGRGFPGYSFKRVTYKALHTDTLQRRRSFLTLALPAAGELGRSAAAYGVGVPVTSLVLN